MPLAGSHFFSVTFVPVRSMNKKKQLKPLSG
jgi:hypothetical protein